MLTVVDQNVGKIQIIAKSIKLLIIQKYYKILRKAGNTYSENKEGYGEIKEMSSWISDNTLVRKSKNLSTNPASDAFDS